jgi:dolichol-phosphate mannosyltransferase
MINPAAKHGDGALAAKAPNGRARAPGLSQATKSVTIIVPTRNEVENVGQLVSQIVANTIPFYEILFVDDGSIDGTHDLILSLSSTHSIRLVDQDRAVPGSAAAVMEGAREIAVDHGRRSESPARTNQRFVGPLLNGTADMVIGSRYVEGGSTAHWPLWRRTLLRAGSAIALFL